ncbi:multiple inositol polyphosphate phosphatase 1-like [Planococcus citri]|uniref:multiple inositol polyphosphate phosphatase 1-like n=1 Tax=Planococcus citri TaxID=170843 RepID=UPI0031F80522
MRSFKQSYRNMAMKMALVLPFVIFICSLLQIRAETDYCYADNPTPYRYFSRKTPYLISRGPQILDLENCEPVYLWALIRHGTTYPDIYLTNSMKQLSLLRDKIILNNKNKRGYLCEKDFKNLENWSFNFTWGEDHKLTAQGVNDQVFLAELIINAFPKLFESPKRESFKFQSSAYNSTKESAIVFSNELFETNYNTTAESNIEENDELLRLNKHCPKYLTDVEGNLSLHKETELFQKSDFMKSIIANVSLRLGFSDQLSFDEIYLMYETCAYENAANTNSNPPFCAVFSTKELKVLEYINDMNEYYSRGYGNQLASHLGCIVIRDMLTSLINASQDVEGINKGKFLFTQSDVLLPATVKLGLHKEKERLGHNNYKKLIKRRKWRLSIFDSFAANIIAALYKCPGQNGTHQNSVVIHQNERPVVYPMQCTGHHCTLEGLKTIFRDVLDENLCSMEFCYNFETQNAGVGAIFLHFSAFSVLTFVCIIVNLFY